MSSEGAGAMSEEDESALVPQLRFPEFRGAGEWEEKTLGAVCDMQAGKFVVASEISEKKADGLYPCFGGNGLRGYTKTYNQSGRYSLIGRQGALCGNVNLVDGDFHATEHAVVTTPKAGNSTDWLFYNLCLLNLNRFATGQAQPGLSVEVLEKVACVVPKDKDEQQKIADCLSSLDELIVAETQKLDTLKTHKKGLMQQLFPREGETVPRLRFPEFREAGEWRLDPLSTFVSALDAGVSVNAGDRPAMPTENGVLKTSCVTNGVFELLENKVVLEPEELERVTERVHKDTIIISRMNTPDLVGASAYVESDATNIFLPDRLWAAKPAPNANMRFIAYILGSGRGRRALSELAAGSSGSMKNIAKAAVLELVISAPEPAEQQSIDYCLADLDDLISAQSQEIEALKTHKKGLMQQLFPVLDEVAA